MNTFFISDTHFGHFNVIKYDNREFSSVFHMDESMIQAWNDVVKKNDIVYHLGDFSFNSNFEKVKQLISRLNGKIVLIRGNHDYKLSKNTLGLFHSVHDFLIYRVNGYRLVLSHYAFETWYRMPVLQYRQHYKIMPGSLLASQEGSLSASIYGSPSGIPPGSFPASRPGIHLHGHSHGKLVPKPLRYDMWCVDCAYRPVHIDYIIGPSLFTGRKANE